MVVSILFDGMVVVYVIQTVCNCSNSDAEFHTWGRWKSTQWGSGGERARIMSLTVYVRWAHTGVLYARHW